VRKAIASKQHFSVACLCNIANARPWIRGKEILDLYLADQMDREREHSLPDLTPEQVKGLVGLYQNPENGDVLRVVVTDGKLQADFGDGPVNLRTITTTQFHLIDYRPFETSLKFGPAHDVSPREFVVNTANERPARFEAVDELKVSSAEFAAYIGDYWSDELHATYRLAINKENLWLTDLNDIFVTRTRDRDGIWLLRMEHFERAIDRRECALAATMHTQTGSSRIGRERDSASEDESYSTQACNALHTASSFDEFEMGHIMRYLIKRELAPALLSLDCSAKRKYGICAGNRLSVVCHSLLPQREIQSVAGGHGLKVINSDHHSAAQSRRSPLRTEHLSSRHHESRVVEGN